MKLKPEIIWLAPVLLILSGCGENGVGGGAYQATSVVVLPPDLSGDSDAEDDADADADDSGAATSAGSGPGNFSGRVVLTGGAPTLGPIFAKGADIKDAPVCAAQDMPDERLVVGADNGVSNVFIYLQKAPKGTPKPEPGETAVIFDQEACRFIPHCLVVPTGQTIKVLSNDKVAHNTHSYPSRNTAINQTVDPGDREGKLQFAYKSKENEPLKVVCDFHAWMVAWHLPVDHPFAAVTDADGNFEIRDLPSGDHTFVIWHEAAKGRYVNRKLKVSIRPGETTTQDIEYAASQLEL